jgi:peptidoglycan/LPS O-acetylase OafA/YrhL
MYPLEFWLDARWAPLFAAGMLFYRISRRGWDGQRSLLLLWAFSLTLWYGWTGAEASKLGREAVLLGLPMQVVLCLTLFHGVFLLVVSGRWTMRPSPLVYWFGALTYPVYLLHQNIGYIALMAPGWRHLDFHLRVGLVVGAVVLLAWLVNRWVERPLSRRLRAVIDPAAIVPRTVVRPASKLRAESIPR